MTSAPRTRCRRWRLATLGVLFAASAADLQAQRGRSTIVAGIADAATGAPLAGAELLLPDLRLQARADWMGEARIRGVPPGVHRVQARHVGYASAELRLMVTEDTVGPVFMLERIATALDTVHVEAAVVPAHLRDFEARRRMGLGRFLTAEDLAKEGSAEFLTVATARFPGLRPMTNLMGRTMLSNTRGACGSGSPLGKTLEDRSRGPTSMRSGMSPAKKPGSTSGAPAASAMDSVKAEGSCFTGTHCPVQIYLDDMKLEEDADLARTWDLAGVEFYSGASVPVRYRRDGAGCGVMLLWSKR